MNTTTMSMRLRASRFFDERYSQRESPNYFPELACFGIIVVTIICSILMLASAMATPRLDGTRRSYELINHSALPVFATH